MDANGAGGLLGPAAGQGHQYQRSCQIFQDARSRTAMVVSPHVISRATGQKVIGAQIALRKPDGSFDGAVGIALDVHWFDYLLREHPAAARARWWRCSTAMARCWPPTTRRWRRPWPPPR